MTRGPKLSANSADVEQLPAELRELPSGSFAFRAELASAGELRLQKTGTNEADEAPSSSLKAGATGQFTKQLGGESAGNDGTGRTSTSTSTSTVTGTGTVRDPDDL